MRIKKVTEAEWLNLRDRSSLFDCLPRSASKRKLRLLAFACCRRIWHLVTDKRLQKSLEVAERYTDGLATQDQLKKADSAARAAFVAVFESEQILPPYAEKAAAAFSRAIKASWKNACNACSDAAWAVHWAARKGHGIAAREAEDAVQTDLLRDIFGNPFRRVKVDPSWLTWRDATIPKLAQTIYDERNFEGLPILADALEEAGCTNADILNHCRGPGPHVRGCWVVDLLLGKS